MALSGTLSNAYRGWTYRIEWSAKQSVENNTSTVTCVHKLICDSGYGLSIGSRSNSCTVGGVTRDFASSAISTSGGTTHTLGTTTHTVSHNADGTKSVSISGTFNIEATLSGTYRGSIQTSGSVTLNTIPRATTPTVSGTLSLGSSITISTSGRASTDFTHNLYYSWGSQVIDSLIASGVTTSKVWTIPKTLAEYIQAGSSGTMHLKCVTYKGSTVIGTKTITLVITVPNTAEFQPTINTISAIDANVLPVDCYVVGKSRLKISVTAVGAYVDGSSNRNSYLANAQIEVEGSKYTVTLGQNATGTFEVITNTLTKAGTYNVVVTVTDSRGRHTTKNFGYTVYDYFPPKIDTFVANRCLEDGTLDESGTYVFFRMKTTVANVNDFNAKTYKIVYENNGSEVTLKSGTLSAYTDNELSYNSYSDGVTFSVDYSWIVRVYVYDSFNSSSPAAVTVVVPTEATFIDWRTNGKGFAFGKVSTRDAFECGWSMYDRFDTLVTNGMAWYTGSGNSATDPNVTKEHLILTDKNTPATGFWYIETLFYSTKSDTANRTQIAYPYSSIGSVYVRNYYNGAWNPWAEFAAISESGTSGIWNYRKMANGDVELWGTYSVSNIECTTALGNWYRTPVFKPDSFPFSVNSPKMVSSYESDGYGALLWATTVTTPAAPSNFYLIRPTSATIASGKINMRVVGRWK